MKPKVLVILGPTATGKSDLAVRLAQKFNGEIISADSRQVYKGLDIGTGKITKEEMGGIPHHLLDVADPKETFTVAEFIKLASNALRYIIVKNKLPIVVGGTGFYIDTLAGLISLPEVPPNPILRAELEQKSLEDLFLELKQKDFERAKTIDSKNKVRLIRALEIIDSFGKVPRFGSSASKSHYNFIFIGLKSDQKELEEKIYTRLIKRLPGMLEEAKRLVSGGLSFKRMENLGLEYKYLALYLQDILTKEEMVAELFTEIKKYSKRQIQWFKRNPKITWFDSNDQKEIEIFIEKALN